MYGGGPLWRGHGWWTGTPGSRSLYIVPRSRDACMAEIPGPAEGKSTGSQGETGEKKLWVSFSSAFPGGGCGAR